MFRLNLNPFYSPDDSGTIESGKLSPAAIEEFLGTEDGLKLEETPIDGEENTEEGIEALPKEKEEIETLEEELEQDLKDPDEDEVVMPVRRKEVIAKYPNLFKEFPHLDKAVYREQKYSELFPTLGDAKLAVDKAEVLDGISSQLSDGNTTTLMQSLKEEDPEAFNTLVDNYLNNLQLVDKGAYFHVLGNIVKHLVITMNNSDDADTKTAGAILYKFIFNSEKFENPTRLSNRDPKDDRETKLEEREVEFRKNVLETHVNSINTRIDNTVKAILDRNIDPRDTMNSYVKSKAINDCISTVEVEIKKDTRFQGIIDKLWERAADTNYSQESLDKIRTAYLSKAKGILPTIIRKTRQDALKGLGNKSPNESRQNPLPVGRPSTGKRETSSNNSPRGSDKEKAKSIPRGTKSIDFLMKD